MSKSNDNNDRWDGSDSSGKRVTDEEGTVDQKLKNRIIQARQRVDEREDDVFVGAALEGVQANPGQLVQIWQTTVKQYLRAIEPLLQSDDIEGAEYYYRQLPLVDEIVPPPDGPCMVFDGVGDNDPETREIRWSVFYRDDADNTAILKDNPLFGRGFEPPEPRPLTLTGLKDVIEFDQETFEWRVPLTPQKLPPNRQIAEVTETIWMQKPMLETAVRKADTFLQEAGVGLEIGHQQTDDPDDNPF